MAFYDVVLRLSLASVRRFRIYRDSDGVSDQLLRRCLDDLRVEIRDYVQRAFGREASENEYLELIFDRLAGTFSDQVGPETVNSAIREELRSITHNHRRAMFRASQRDLSLSTFDPRDSANEQRGEQIERQAEAAARIELIFRHLSPQDRALLSALFLMDGGEANAPRNRHALARALGLSKNALDKRISRLLLRVRQEEYERNMKSVDAVLSSAESRPLTARQQSLMSDLNRTVEIARGERELHLPKAVELSIKAYRMAQDLARLLKLKVT